VYVLPALAQDALPDARFVGFAQAVNDFDLASGNLAMVRSGDANIRGYATRAMSDANWEADALSKSRAEAGVSYAPDGSMGPRTANLLAQLNTLQGPAFDAAYARAQLEVQTQAETLLTLATAQQFPLWAGWGACWLGWSLAMQGQSEADMMQMRQGLAAILATGQLLSQPFCLVLLGEAAEHAGQVTEGLRLVADALAAFEASRRGDMLVEAYRVQGNLLLRHAPPDTAQAEACFQQALTIARRQQAKSWELRATVSLSRWWQQQGKCQEARDLLAPIYGWCTEGFDTATHRLPSQGALFQGRVGTLQY
jgi:predicted ATPase